MSHEHLSDSIHARVAALETQNRRLRAGVGIIALCLIGAVSLGAATQVGMFSTITAERIDLVDKEGRRVISLGVGEVGTGMAVYRTDGSPAAIFGMSSAEQAGSLVLFDADGRARMGMGMDDGVPGFAIADAAGTKVISIGGTENRHGIVVIDSKGKERAGLGLLDGEPVCVLADSDGKAKIGMESAGAGQYQFVWVDEDGERVVLDE